MAYVRQGFYWYRSRRQSHHVVSECVGSGDLTRLVVTLKNKTTSKQRIVHGGAPAVEGS